MLNAVYVAVVKAPKFARICPIIQSFNWFKINEGAEYGIFFIS